METLTPDVLVVGGGPCGLMLAGELGRRGIRVLLVDAKASTAFNPQANATQARTMEHFRRLGIAQEIRAQGLPADHPTDIAYFTRYTAHELARRAYVMEEGRIVAEGPADELANRPEIRKAYLGLETH